MRASTPYTAALQRENATYKKLLDTSYEQKSQQGEGGKEGGKEGGEEVRNEGGDREGGREGGREEGGREAFIWLI